MTYPLGLPCGRHRSVCVLGTQLAGARGPAPLRQFPRACATHSLRAGPRETSTGCGLQGRGQSLEVAGIGEAFLEEKEMSMGPEVP